MRIPRWTTATLVAVSLASGAAYAAAEPSGGAGPGLPKFEQPPTALEATTPEQERPFAALRREQQAADRLPEASRRVVSRGPESDFGANPDLVRAVGDPDASRRGFLLPGRGVLCLADDAGTVTCNATEDAAAGQLALSFEHPEGSELIGVVPDGVQTVDVSLDSGRVKTVAVTENGYQAVLDEPLIGVSYQLNGETQTVGISSP